MPDSYVSSLLFLKWPRLWNMSSGACSKIKRCFRNIFIALNSYPRLLWLTRLRSRIPSLRFAMISTQSTFHLCTGFWHACQLVYIYAVFESLPSGFGKSLREQILSTAYNKRHFSPIYHTNLKIQTPTYNCHPTNAKRREGRETKVCLSKLTTRDLLVSNFFGNILIKISPRLRPLRVPLRAITHMSATI